MLHDLDIPKQWIALAMSQGVRTNVPYGCPTRPWVHKYMYQGLHVITDVSGRTIIKAHWAVSDPQALQKCKYQYMQTCA